MRAERLGLPFDLTEEDIEIPLRCPVLGLPLAISDGRPSANSPSLDRIYPERGYVRGNVLVVSMRANELKRDATIQELMLLVAFYKELP